MYSIFNSYLLKLTGTVAGLAFFSFALKGQETAQKLGRLKRFRCLTM